MQILPVNNFQTNFNGIKIEISKVSPAIRNHMLDSLENPVQRQTAQKWCEEIISKLNKYTNERLIDEILYKKKRELGIPLKTEQVWPKETKASIFAVHKDRYNKDSVFGVSYENIDPNSSRINMDFYIDGASGRHFIGTERDILRTAGAQNGRKLGGLMSFVSQIGAMAGYIISGYNLDEDSCVKHNFEKFIEAELEKQPEYQGILNNLK